MDEIVIPPVEAVLGKRFAPRRMDKWAVRHLNFQQSKLVGCAFARQVLHIMEFVRPRCKVSRNIIEMVEKVVFGVDKQESLCKYTRKYMKKYGSAVFGGYALTPIALNTLIKLVGTKPATYGDLVLDIEYAIDHARLAVMYATIGQPLVGRTSTHARNALVEDFTTLKSFKRPTLKQLDEKAKCVRKDQTSLLQLFLPPKPVNQGVRLSEASIGLVNTWLSTWFSNKIDARGAREILADSLMEDGFDEQRCQWVRFFKDWRPGMWPMVPEVFVK